MRLLHNVFVIGLVWDYMPVVHNPNPLQQPLPLRLSLQWLIKPQVVVQTLQPKLSPKKAVVKPKAVSKPNAAVDTLTTADVLCSAHGA